MKHFWVTDKKQMKQFVSNKSFDMFIMGLILMNSVVLGMMVSPSFEANYAILALIDKLCLAIFVVEMCLKLYVYGKDFFKSRWNVFDFTIILLSSFEFASSLIIFRAFRLFRALKYMNRFSRLKRIIDTFLSLMPNFCAFVAAYGVVLYVFAIMAVNLFSFRFSDFATLSGAVLTLFQVFTLDGWADITKAVMSVFPHAWIFFVSYLLISALLLLSFVLSLIDQIVKQKFYFDNGYHKNPYYHKQKRPFDGKSKQTRYIK